MSILQQTPEAEVLLSPDRMSASPVVMGEASDRAKHELEFPKVYIGAQMTKSSCPATTCSSCLPFPNFSHLYLMPNIPKSLMYKS